jgi:hypothetical protein
MGRGVSPERVRLDFRWALILWAKNAASDIVLIRPSSGDNFGTFLHSLHTDT